MSGLRNCPPGPRDENDGHHIALTFGLDPVGERASGSRMGGHEGQEVGAVGQVDGRQEVVVGFGVGER